RSVHAVVVSGPVATSVPTTADVLERWRSLTGRQGHPSDPEFSHFVSITLGTLLLEGERLDRYQRLLECFATLCAGRGDAHALAEESWALRTKLEDARFEQRMWETARSMVNEQTARVWFSPASVNDLLDLGLSEVPEHALVGLLMSRRD